MRPLTEEELAGRAERQAAIDLATADHHGLRESASDEATKQIADGVRSYAPKRT
jgi:hypothetical protein